MAGLLTVQTPVFSNAGTVVLGGTNESGNTGFAVAGASTTLTGGGTIQLQQRFDQTNIYALTSGATLVNANEMITGFGTIGLAGSALALTNGAAGLIKSSDDIRLSIVTGGAPLRNAGVIESNGRGPLTIDSTTIDNTGGTLLADKDGNRFNSGTLALTGDTVIGGTLLTGQYFSAGSGLPDPTMFGVITFAGAGNALDGSAAAVSVVNTGTVQVLSGGSLALRGAVQLQGATLQATGALSNAGTLAGAGAVAGNIVNTGLLLARGGTLDVTGALTGAGAIAIAANAAFELAGASGETVDFQGAAAGRLILDAPRTYAGTFANAVSGDTIDLTGVNVTSAPTLAGSTLTLTLSDSSTLHYAVANLGGGERFVLSSASAFGSRLTVACFVAGTRIETTDGPVAVENLRVGDRVRTPRGVTAATARPVRWVGRRTLDLDRHPAPESVAPIRVRAGAFGHGAPARDVWLSPDHAVFVANGAAGCLVPIGLLVDGAGARREKASGTVRYFHVELDRHDVLLADGLPVESYLETGQRAAFANADPVPRAELAASACAELITGGDRLDAIRASLALAPA